MKMHAYRYSTRAAVGLVAGLVIGFVVVVICHMVWAIVKGLPVNMDWDDADITRVLVASLPYLVLAVCGIASRLAWGLGLCLTAVFWSYYLWCIIQSESADANIGLGMLMLFSPLPIIVGSLLGLVVSVRRRRASGVSADR